MDSRDFQLALQFRDQMFAWKLTRIPPTNPGTVFRLLRAHRILLDPWLRLPPVS